MNQPEVGKLIEGEAQRDAIHVAIAPVVAGQTLRAGMHVYLKNGVALANGYGLSQWGPVPDGKTNTVGIVDPYLGKDDLNPGDRFYLFLYPGSVSSLRHDWVHPDFPSEDYAYSKKWLEEFANGLEDEPWDWEEHKPAEGSPYDLLMKDAAHFLKEGFIYYGRSENTRLPEGFWKHYKIITGEEAACEAEYLPCRC